MPTTLLIDALRDYLLASAVVRDPRNAGSLPPCWRTPRDGVPAPGEGEGAAVGEDVVVGLFPAPGLARDPYDASALRTDAVDLVIRSRTAPLAIQFDDQIRSLLVDKRGWTMGGLQIVESRLVRPLDLVGSDKQAFDWVAGYTFERVV